MTMQSTTTMPGRRTAAPLLAVLLMLGGCAAQTTRQAPAVRPAGFLSDYSKLRPGGAGEARLIYRADGVDLSPFDKVIVDRVVVWGTAIADDRPREELQHLADLLYGSILSRLQTYYVVVNAPGPGVMRVRVALTEARPSSVGLDILSNIGPVTGLISGAKQMATGTHAFVGAASVEGEVLDAPTGKVLLAAVDRRVGEKTLTGATNPWSDVEDAFRVWADRFIDRLQAEGGARRPLPYWAQPPR